MPFTVGNCDATKVRTVSSLASCNVRRLVPACVVEVSLAVDAVDSGCEDGFKMAASGVCCPVRLRPALDPVCLVVALVVLIVGCYTLERLRSD